MKIQNRFAVIGVPEQLHIQVTLTRFRVIQDETKFGIFVFSRTIEQRWIVHAVQTSIPHARLYIAALTDQALPSLIPLLTAGHEDALWVHTAGSLPMGVFEGLALHYGVLYPMQTFTRERPLDFAGIPCFVEGSDDAALGTAEALARGISGRVYRLGSEERRHLHLAAVFACNFANRCYGMAAEILERRGIPFDVMLPLIDETARKVHYMSPREAQTGPAVRYDAGVIGAQSALLAGSPDLRRIYDAMSESIHNAAVEADK